MRASARIITHGKSFLSVGFAFMFCFILKGLRGRRAAGLTFLSIADSSMKERRDEPKSALKTQLVRAGRPSLRRSLRTVIDGRKQSMRQEVLDGCCPARGGLC